MFCIVFLNKLFGIKSALKINHWKGYRSSTLTQNYLRIVFPSLFFSFIRNYLMHSHITQIVIEPKAIVYIPKWFLILNQIDWAFNNLVTDIKQFLLLIVGWMMHVKLVKLKLNWNEWPNVKQLLLLLLLNLLNRMLSFFYWKFLIEKTILFIHLSHVHATLDKLKKFDVKVNLFSVIWCGLIDRYFHNSNVFNKNMGSEKNYLNWIPKPDVRIGLMRIY